MYIELSSLKSPPKLATGVTSLTETAELLKEFEAIGEWKTFVHYVRDVTMRRRCLSHSHGFDSFNVGQSHETLPLICIALMASKTWLKLNVSLVLVVTYSKIYSLSQKDQVRERHRAMGIGLWA